MFQVESPEEVWSARRHPGRAPLWPYHEDMVPPHFLPRLNVHVLRSHCRWRHWIPTKLQYPRGKKINIGVRLWTEKWLL